MHRAIWIALFAVGLGACSESKLEREGVNRPPETRITSGPPDSARATSYRVAFAWSASDPDGAVDHYDLLILDHPGAWDSIADVVVTVPGADDSRWQSTTAIESILVVSADTLRLDPSALPPDEVRRRFFERWHTVFVRAVDDRGAPDPTPDYRSFNARTLAPTVALLPPFRPGQQISVAPSVTLRWTGEDPLDLVTVELPDSSRWVVIPTVKQVDGTYDGFPDSLYRLSRRFRWSPWRAWDAADGSGTRATLHGLAVLENRHRGFYLFAVQAKDAAGAVTPVFDWETPDKNNVAPILVLGDRAPLVVVEDLQLGTFRFEGHTRLTTLEVGANQPIRFRWRGDSSHYGSQVTAYRYGWDILDPSDAAQYECNWSLDCTQQIGPPKRHGDGLHRFVLEARDSGNQVTHVEIELRVRAFPMRRPLLLVDDTTQPHPSDEPLEDRRWRVLLDSLVHRHTLQFEPGRDIYDVADHMGAPPTSSLLSDYRATIWTVVQGTGSSGLRQLAEFFDPFVERHVNVGISTNYVQVYLDNGGMLWISGSQPMGALWRIFQPDPFPANLTNWDDPFIPHPEVDSVGVQSVAYRMGVEALDWGTGGLVLLRRRDETRHGCVGFRLAASSGAPSTASGHDVPPAWLAPDITTWPRPGLDVNPSGGRSNVEIYNMPRFLAEQALAPPASRVLVLYTYASATGEDPAAGLVYPLTADRQPAILLAKRAPEDLYFSRAICGFELWRLAFASHLDLADHILFHRFAIVAPHP